MATRFELLLCGDDPARLRAAGEQALDEIDRLENQLSLFRPGSEIAHLNARAAVEPVRVSPALLTLLDQAKTISEATDGAFDITVAPLVRCWGFMDGPGRAPNAAELKAAREVVGMDLVELNRSDSTVRFAKPGVMLDLGAIGKGYAIERAAEVLREAGVSSALMHAGTSSICAIGTPPNADHWLVAIENPFASVQRRAVQTVPDIGAATERSSKPSLATLGLKTESLSVSAISEKFFEADGKTFGHVLDPRTGQPACNALLAAVVLPSATETDALSTALLTLGSSGVSHISSFRPTARTLVLHESKGELLVDANGIACIS